MLLHLNSKSESISKLIRENLVKIISSNKSNLCVELQDEKQLNLVIAQAVTAIHHSSNLPLNFRFSLTQLETEELTEDRFNSLEVVAHLLLQFKHFWSEINKTPHTEKIKPEKLGRYLIVALCFAAKYVVDASDVCLSSIELSSSSRYRANAAEFKQIVLQYPKYLKDLRALEKKKNCKINHLSKKKYADLIILTQIEHQYFQALLNSKIHLSKEEFAHSLYSFLGLSINAILNLLKLEEDEEEQLLVIKSLIAKDPICAVEILTYFVATKNSKFVFLLLSEYPNLADQTDPQGKKPADYASHDTLWDISSTQEFDTLARKNFITPATDKNIQGKNYLHKAAEETNFKLALHILDKYPHLADQTDTLNKNPYDYAVDYGNKIENDFNIQFKSAVTSYATHKNKFFGIPWIFQSTESYDSYQNINNANSLEEKYRLCKEFMNQHPDKEWAKCLKNTITLELTNR